MQLIPAHLDDLPDLLHIESASFSQPWSKADFLAELGKHPPSIYVARKDRKSSVLGYICFWDVAGEIQMLNLAVHPEYRRQEVGRTLLTFLLKQTEARKATKVFLEVRPSNQAAQTLYRSLGFKLLYRRPNYYPPEGEDALVMEWSL